MASDNETNKQSHVARSPFINCLHNEMKVKQSFRTVLKLLSCRDDWPSGISALLTLRYVTFHVRGKQEVDCCRRCPCRCCVVENYWYSVLLFVDVVVNY